MKGKHVHKKAVQICINKNKAFQYMQFPRSQLQTSHNNHKAPYLQSIQHKLMDFMVCNTYIQHLREVVYFSLLNTQAPLILIILSNISLYKEHTQC